MKTIAAYDLKTHCSQVLTKVSDGQSFRVTRHGKEVAYLTPVPGEGELKKSAQQEAEEAVEAIKRIRKRLQWKLKKGETIKDLIEEGRR